VTKFPRAHARVAQPTCTLSCHTTCVKWPVALEKPPLARQEASSATQRSTAARQLSVVPMARFSPYGPLECWKTQVSETPWAYSESVRDQRSGGAP
jgi:hypothetical protein